MVLETPERHLSAKTDAEDKSREEGSTSSGSCGSSRVATIASAGSRTDAQKVASGREEGKIAVPSRGKILQFAGKRFCREQLNA
jgi:hypothetical protein